MVCPLYIKEKMVFDMMADKYIYYKVAIKA